MTTNELIAALQLADPSGKLKVVVAVKMDWFAPPLKVPEIRTVDQEFYSQCETSTEIKARNIGENVVII